MAGIVQEDAVRGTKAAVRHTGRALAVRSAIIVITGMIPATPDVATMPDDPVRQSFTAALDALVEDIKHDRAILAAILCGSLSHDTVWSKSDIDLVLVTIDDRKVESNSLSLNADGVNVHAMLLPRTEFRRMVEGAPQLSFTHSFLAKGRLLYSTDPTITSMFETLTRLGARDRQLQLLRAAGGALASIYKAHKWFITRGDLDYTALWILYAATSLAEVEVISAGLIPDREVIPQAQRLNPAFFKTIYSDLLNTRKTRPQVQSALDAVDRYLRERAEDLFALVLEHLAEAGETRTCRDIDDHFLRHVGVSGVSAVCEYLADQGLLGKVSMPARLTKKSSADVQELAFYPLRST
jgi:hypothetical protein